MAHPFNTLNNENGVWKAPIFSPLLSATVELIVEAEKQPLAWQKSIFDELTDNNSALKNDLYQAISAYCHATYSDYHDSTSSHSNCHSSNNAQGLTPHTILICDMAPEKKEISLLFDCAWESEHGLHVIIQDGKIADIGFQRIAF